MMDKIDVAVRTGDNSYRGFTGYIVPHGDKESLEKAKDWARNQTWDDELRKHLTVHEPDVHTFDNEGFTAKILQSAGGSSQGGRLSFWACEVEKDGIKFTIGVNDAVLADLIRSSDMSNGLVKQKVMFARRAGQPGLIHEGMQSYQDATADMAHKATMKAAKKTSKWEIGGVYSSITQTAICLGEVFDSMEEYTVQNNTWRYGRTETKFRKRDVPVKTLAWVHIYNPENGLPKDFNELMNKKLEDKRYVYFYTGKPPARAKTGQLEVKDTDMKLLDKVLSLRRESVNYGEVEITKRFARKLNV